jgi:CelD/BcsL family acetyltransferase involved in cellulose biosynthesis
MDSIRIGLEPLTDVGRLQREWQALEAEADPSFFLSWGWVGCWLNHLPSGAKPWILRADDGGSTAGLAVLISKKARRRVFVQSLGLHLHETGEPRLDQLCIEHNGILARRDRAAEIVHACLRYLVDRNHWDEIVLSAVSSEYLNLLPGGARASTILWRKPMPLVDLRALRTANRSYLSVISRDTRQQIRRAMRLYGQSGPLKAEAAVTLAQAEQFLASLVHLHQLRWERKGQSAVFADPLLLQFHRALVAARFPKGEIQLLRITAGSNPIGYLYNFRKDDRIFQYQCGFDFGSDNRLKPGLVSHALAIDYNLSAGASSYEFLMGDERYKTSLATHSRELVRVALQRRRLAFQVENSLRRAKSQLSYGLSGLVRRQRSMAPRPARMGKAPTY